MNNVIDLRKQLNPFEKQTILAAFKRCYGLQDAFKGRTQMFGDRTGPILIGALAEQTGFRIEFIKQHIVEISNL